MRVSDLRVSDMRLSKNDELCAIGKNIFFRFVKTREPFRQLL